MAAVLGMTLLLVVSAYALDQGRRGVDEVIRTGLLLNLLGVAVLWLRTDKPMEGPILAVIAPRHGITLADLLIALPLLVGVRLPLQQPQVVSARLNRK